MSGAAACLRQRSTRLALAATWPLDASSEAHEIVGESLRRADQERNVTGLRGARGKFAGGSPLNRDGAAGQITWRPGPLAIARMLPRLFGGESSPGVYLPSERLPAFHALVERSAGLFGYRQLRVARATLVCRAKQPFELRVEVAGESGGRLNDGLFPALVEGTGAEAAWFTGHSARLTLGEVEQEFHLWRLTIDNGLRAVGGIGAPAGDELVATDRRIELQIVTPAVTGSPAMELWEDRHAARCGRFTIDAGEQRLTFSFPHLVRKAGKVAANSVSSARVRTTDRRVTLRLSAQRPLEEPEATITLGDTS